MKLMIKLINSEKYNTNVLLFLLIFERKSLYNLNIILNSHLFKNEIFKVTKLLF